ncbi:Molybdopterin synthase catalytic subunit [Pseudocercospora fuligena]|uniref:Molybdopterin synthase catalytic subunit n=1 Tax=Pseudocercospora fuligena TaxID=685502 RepID=A0A8H6VNY1_9PEZI|nr:Molybdopterin synthase catalytic subunit [Pseudocercospora fuligena]
MGAQDVPPVSPSSSSATKPLETIGEATKMPSLEKKPATATAFTGELSRQDEPNVYVSLTYDALDATAQMARVKSAKAGAVVLFAGTTRDSFNAKTVTHLSYSTYTPLALKTLSHIARTLLQKHSLTSIAITHRLGPVQIGEESILIAVSSPHRQAAWKAGEECLEEVKKKVEIWKEEWFEDGGMWRSNRDGEAGVPVKPVQRETMGSRSLPLRRGSEIDGQSSGRRPSQAEGSGRRPSEGGRRISETKSRRKSSTSSAAPLKRAPTGEFTEGGFEV